MDTDTKLHSDDYDLFILTCSPSFSLSLILSLGILLKLNPTKPNDVVAASTVTFSP